MPIIKVKPYHENETTIMMPGRKEKYIIEDEPENKTSQQKFDSLGDITQDVYSDYLAGKFDQDQHIIIRNPDDEPKHENIDDSIEAEIKISYNPNFSKIIGERFDLTDTKTRRSLCNLTEAEQNSVVASLTAKLYNIVAKKAMDIDFGKIPDSKGDITKVENYSDLKESISLLKDIVKEYKQDTKIIDTLSEALANIQTRKEIFGKAFDMKIEFGEILYNSITLALFDTTSFLISTCIEFIKSPKDDGFEIAFDQMRYAKSKSFLLYETLTKFNTACKKGDTDKSLEYIVKENITKKVKNEAVTATVLGGISAFGILTTLLILIVPIMRECVFFFYYARTKIADMCEVQANLLQMNIYNIEYNNNEIPQNKKKEIIAEQKKKVEWFKKTANFFAIDSKSAEVKAEQEIKAENSDREKLDDDEKPSNDDSGSLF